MDSVTWLVDEVPEDESKIPVPDPVPTHTLLIDVGLWVDGARGWGAPVHMVDLALARGYSLDSADMTLLTWARLGGRTEDMGHPDYPDFWGELQSDVERWLNDHVAPDGHSFGWRDGDFMLATDADWCHWSGENCTDLDHDHDPYEDPLTSCGCPVRIVRDEGHQVGCERVSTT